VVLAGINKYLARDSKTIARYLPYAGPLPTIGATPRSIAAVAAITAAAAEALIS
jgi:hypothetical protein